MIRTEINVLTGESRQIDTTAYMVDGAIVLIDDGEPVPPGAVLASTIPTPEAVDEPPQLTPSQITKLAGFLTTNPDIAEALGLQAP